MDSVDSLATFEEKLDIEDLILPCKPTKLAQIKIVAVKEEEYWKIRNSLQQFIKEKSVLPLYQLMMGRSNTN